MSGFQDTGVAPALQGEAAQAVLILCSINNLEIKILRRKTQVSVDAENPRQKATLFKGAVTASGRAGEGGSCSPFGELRRAGFHGNGACEDRDLEMFPKEASRSACPSN